MVSGRLQHRLSRTDDAAREKPGLRRLGAMRGILTAIAVLAALATTPWVLLTFFYIGLQEGTSKAPGTVMASVCAVLALASFIGAVSISRSGPIRKYIALLAVGALLIVGCFVIAESALSIHMSRHSSGSASRGSAAG